MNSEFDRIQKCRRKIRRSHHLEGEAYVGRLKAGQDTGKVKKDFQKTELKLEKRSCGDERRKQVYKERHKNG